MESNPLTRGIPHLRRIIIFIASILFLTFASLASAQNRSAGTKDRTAVTPAAPERLDARGKFHYFVTQSFRPGVLVSAGLYSAYDMVRSPNRYPPEWKEGANGLSRHYGDFMASWTAVQGGKLAASLALHEDPRYVPSLSHNLFRRSLHALVFVVVDRSDSGARRPAIANLTGALAGGFVGNSYLPDGYNDAAHAWVRSGLAYSGFATSNLADEFRPEINKVLKKLHLPLVR